MITAPKRKRTLPRRLIPGAAVPRPPLRQVQPGGGMTARWPSPGPSLKKWPRVTKWRVEAIWIFTAQPDEWLSVAEMERLSVAAGYRSMTPENRSDRLRSFAAAGWLDRRRATHSETQGGYAYVYRLTPAALAMAAAYAKAGEDR